MSISFHRRGVTEAPAALLGRARLLRNVFAALVATFLGATDGLSLGALVGHERSTAVYD